MNEPWPTDAASFRAAYLAHMAEYHALHRMPWQSRSATQQDRFDWLRRRLTLMERDAPVRDLPTWDKGRVPA